MPSTHEELLRRYVKAADAGNWFLARQIGKRLIPLAPVGSTGGGLDATRAAARPG